MIPRGMGPTAAGSAPPIFQQEFRSSSRNRCQRWTASSPCVPARRSGRSGSPTMGSGPTHLSSATDTCPWTRLVPIKAKLSLLRQLEQLRRHSVEMGGRSEVLLEVVSLLLPRHPEVTCPSHRRCREATSFELLHEGGRGRRSDVDDRASELGWHEALIHMLAQTLKIDQLRRDDVKGLAQVVH